MVCYCHARHEAWLAKEFERIEFSRANKSPQIPGIRGDSPSVS
jgi:hypothetical protein